MNEISKKLDLDFDRNGDIAISGKLIPELLEKLNILSFYNKKPPKSLGREWVEKSINPLIKKNYKPKDLLHTFCEHIAIQIGKYLNEKSALLSGGGVLNTYLVRRISYYASSEIIIPNQKIINFKEALIFAFLGVLKLRNEVNCLQSVTGANDDNCGGEINNQI